MADPLIAAWTAWPSEKRAQVLQVGDAEIVQTIDHNMRELWSSEIQARKLGVKGPVQPFDERQLPLLSSMQFDGTVSETVKVYTRVKWPSALHDNADTLVEALRVARRRGTKHCVSKPVKRQRWCQLLQPPAKTWAEFERQLALLLEQVLLQAVSEAQAEALLVAEQRAEGGSSTAAAKQALKRQRQQERRKANAAATKLAPAPGISSLVDASVVPPDALDLVEKEEDQEEFINVEELTCAEEIPCIEASSAEMQVEEDTTEPSENARVTQEISQATAKVEEDRIEPEVDAIVMDELRSQVQRLSLELLGRGARSVAAAALNTVGASAFPKVLGMALGASAGTCIDVASRTGDDRCLPHIEIEARGAEPFLPHIELDSPPSQGVNTATRGVCRAKPPLRSVAVKPWGRGRALPPPPGLPEPQRRPPNGLSQLWTTAFFIPEEARPPDILDDLDLDVPCVCDDPMYTDFSIATSSQHQESSCNMLGTAGDAIHVRDFTGAQLGGRQLTPNDNGSIGSLHSPSSPRHGTPATASCSGDLGDFSFAASHFQEQASVAPTPPMQATSMVPTPVLTWSKTPSPPSTPLQAAASGIGVPPGPAPFSVALQTTYVTVPVAFADNCPHCGRHFVLAANVNLRDDGVSSATEDIWASIGGGLGLANSLGIPGSRAEFIPSGFLPPAVVAAS